MREPIVPESLRVRLATPEDAHELALMSRDLIEEGLRWEWRPKKLGKLLQYKDNLAPVAVVRGEIAGFAVMHYLKDEANLILLAVKPAYRKQGIGSHLVRWLEDCASLAGTPALSLEVRASNAAARIFYHRLGYREMKRINGYYAGIEAGIQMKRKLW
mgnify:CR=1 FL=1